MTQHIQARVTLTVAVNYRYHTQGETGSLNP